MHNLLAHNALCVYPAVSVLLVQAEAGVVGAREAAQAFTAEAILSNIFHFRIHKATEQVRFAPTS